MDWLCSVSQMNFVLSFRSNNNCVWRQENAIIIIAQTEKISILRLIQIDAILDLSERVREGLSSIVIERREVAMLHYPHGKNLDWISSRGSRYGCKSLPGPRFQKTGCVGKSLYCRASFVIIEVSLTSIMPWNEMPCFSWKMYVWDTET